MHAWVRHAGVSAALRIFGVKVAGSWQDFAESLQQQAIGQPREAYRQFQKGTLLKPGKGLLHKGFSRSPAAMAMDLAWPVMGSLLLAKNSPGIGGGELAGDFLGRSVGSLVGGPLGGAVGQMGGGMLLAPVGQAIGRTFDSRNPAVASEE